MKKSKKIALIVLTSLLAVVGFCVISSWRSAQAMADELNCCNHIKDLAVALLIYENDNNDAFPPLNKWCDALVASETNQTPPRTYSFRCPSASAKQACGFSINANLRNVKDRTQVRDDTVILFESDGGWNSVGGLSNAVARHYGPRLWVAFADGTIKDVWLKDIGSLRWLPTTNTSLLEVK
ncbi:MAG: hypothetical protein RLY20_2060 [Verrucomicrobiota bacterium]|jgi:hypothetical protein